jgi:hypothetical protein
MNELMPELLLAEYETIVTALGEDATYEQLVRALVERGDWTEKGASAVVTLAQVYGVFVRRNALALAVALGIEDGSSGI